MRTPGTAPPTVTAQLLNQQGTKMSVIPVTAPAAAAQPLLIDLPLANLAAGQYLIELTATSEGHKPVTDSWPFAWGPTIRISDRVDFRLFDDQKIVRYSLDPKLRDSSQRGTCHGAS